MMDGFVGATRSYLGDHSKHPITLETYAHEAGVMIYHFASAMAPIAIAMLLTALVSNFVQVGFLIAPQAMAPKFEKLNPITGMGRLVSSRSLFELAKALLKLTLVGWVAYITFRGEFHKIMFLHFLTPLGIMQTLGEIAFLVWFRVLLVILVLALIDYAFQRWRHSEELKMTVQEAREEMKQLEGDPQVRQRVRAIQRQMAMQRMMGEVPEADVVVTNPTTYAVALRYNAAEMDTPIVVAKGMRKVAERIRDIAQEHEVPVVQKPELARSLYRNAELHDPVPESLFRAVAEVMKFVFEIDRRAEKRREREAFLTSLRPAAS
jgi:flagellar biosynthetic protein FlhB